MNKLLSAQPVAAIVAAYNEEQTIGPVIRTLVESQLFADIIVVADGSTDHTGDRAREAGASFVQQHPWKRGKGDALIRGVSRTRAPILFFCDADLKGLTIDHLRAILQPVQNGKLAMCVGIHDRGKCITWLCQYLPLIGGERALRRHVFDDIPPELLQGYMVETAMNYSCRARRLPYGTVPMPGARIRRKMQKVGILRGLKEYLHEIKEVASAMILVRIARLRRQFV